MGITSETGNDEEREAKVAELVTNERRVLVATDCLSEGINLQDHFDAVIRARTVGLFSSRLPPETLKATNSCYSPSLRKQNCGALTSGGDGPTDQASRWTSRVATGHDAPMMMIERPTLLVTTCELASGLLCETQETHCWFVRLLMA